MVLGWLRAVTEAAAEDDGPDRPPQAAVVAVAAVRVGFANYDGRACRPSQRTVAQSTGLAVAKVRRVDRYLVDRGFLVVVREATRTAPTEFRLVLPVDDHVAVESTDNGPIGGTDGGSTYTYEQDNGGSTYAYQPADDGSDDGSDGGPTYTDDLPPTTYDSPAAALHNDSDQHAVVAAATDQERDRAVAHLDQHVEYRLATGYQFGSATGYVRSQLPDVLAALADGADPEDRWPTRGVVLPAPASVGAVVEDRPRVVPTTDPDAWHVTDGDDGAPVARPRRTTEAAP